MKKVLIYGHGGAYNHGSEAIASVLIERSRKNHPDCPVFLSTHFKEQDLEYGLKADRFLDIDHKFVMLDKQSASKGLYDEQIYAETITEMDSETICYFMGADNYCYGNWYRWKVLHDAALRAGAEDHLCGCSIDEGYLTNDLVAHIKTFRDITVRESITYRALLERGIKNVRLERDPAFSLKEEPISFPRNYSENKTIAINVSPLEIRREPVSGVLMQNIKNVIDEILKGTEYSILLIPHVEMPMDNDCIPLSELKDFFSDEDRVIMEDRKLSAAQRKYLIARCKYGIFSRTHASIAAYSSGVPCIVIGYSVKAAGIGKDMGMERYVIPLEKLQEENCVLEKFRELKEEYQ